MHAMPILLLTNARASKNILVGVNFSHEVNQRRKKDAYTYYIALVYRQSSVVIERLQKVSDNFFLKPWSFKSRQKSLEEINKTISNGFQ
jgi:hypothetical protein